MPPKLRGEQLDEKLDQTLAEMLSNGYVAAPISRGAIQKRLGLKSRSSLIGSRAERIEAARIRQMRAAGLGEDGKRRRLALEERNEQLQQRIQQLEADRDRYVEQLAEIVQVLQQKGADIEENLKVLRPNWRARG